MPWEISLTLSESSILLITPFTTPTDPSFSPKSDAKEIILLIEMIISSLETINSVIL